MLRGACASSDVLTHAVDDLVQLTGRLRVLRDAASKSKRRGIEETPAGLVAPVALRLFPLLEHVRDLLHADYLGAVHSHDGLVRSVVADRRSPITFELPVLSLPLDSERFDDLPDKAGKVPLQVERVLALDDCIAREGEVVANEGARAEAYANRKFPVVAVTQADHVGVARVFALEREDTEEAHTVRRDAEVLLNDLVTVVAQAVSYQVHHPEVRDRDVRCRSWGCLQDTESVVFDRVSPGVKHKGQGTILLKVAFRKSGSEAWGGLAKLYQLYGGEVVTTLQPHYPAPKSRGRHMGSLSIVHWVLVLGVFGGGGYAIWRSLKQRKAVLAVADGGTLKAAAGPSGLGGWLIILVFGQISGLLKVLVSITEDIDYYKTMPPQAHLAVHIELALNVAYFALLVWTTIAMFRTKRNFPALWKACAIATVLMSPVEAVAVAGVLHVPVSSILDEKAIAQLIPLSIAGAIWWWYLTVSIRVKNTFVN